MVWSGTLPIFTRRPSAHALRVYIVCTRLDFINAWAPRVYTLRASGIYICVWAFGPLVRLFQRSTKYHHCLRRNIPPNTPSQYILNFWAWNKINSWFYEGNGAPIWEESVLKHCLFRTSSHRRLSAQRAAEIVGILATYILLGNSQGIKGFSLESYLFRSPFE